MIIVKKDLVTKNKVLYLLSEEESEELYSLPQFTEEERMDFFTLTAEEENILNELIYSHSKVHLVLQLGYFKAKHRLFKFTAKEIAVDLEYVIQRYFDQKDIYFTMPSRNIQAKNNNRILKIMGYSNSEKQAITLLREKTKNLVKFLSNPHIIFRELLICFDQKRVILPGRSVVQNIIGQEIVLEAKRLESLIIKLSSKRIIKLLNNLLEKKTLDYEITKIKQEPKNFDFNQIQKEIAKHKTYDPVYKFTKILLPKLNISQQNIEYYASLTNHYNRYQLNNFKKEKSYLYLLCYIYYRFQKMNDHLIQTLYYYVDLYSEEAKEYAKNKSAEIYDNIQQYMIRSGELLKKYADPSLSKYKFKKIQQLAFKILPKEKLLFVSNYMTKQCIDKKIYEWEYYSKHYRATLNNLRPPCMVLDFKSHHKDQHLLAGINFIKAAYKAKKLLRTFNTKEFPINFIPDKLRPYLYIKKGKTKKIDHARYEFIVYQQLRKHIEAGNIFCDDSVQYKSFESDIKIKYWVQKKYKILKEIDCPKLTQPIAERLKTLKEQLEPLLEKVNTQIKSGENKHVKIKNKKGKTTWSLKYEKKSDEFDNPFYEKLPKVGINSVLDFVEQQCGFMRAFTHITLHRQNADPDYIKGCLVANATGAGINNFSNNSDLNYDTLLNTQKDYFRLETLRSASDFVIKKAKELPIFKHHNLSPGINHAGRDGKKVTTRVETFLSRHSAKYFGVGKGVVTSTTIFNNLAINTAMMSAHEYEGHYLFDSLFGNFAEITLHRISTDSAGGLQMNHLALDLKSVEYAPCYKSITKKTALIGTFKNPSFYKDCLIQPSHKFKEQLIIDEEANFQPILAALLMKETKQSIIMKKLSSYTRKSKTKDALWEYNNIFLSIYLLKYISDFKMRQDVRGALNRNEAYNQLRATIESTGSSRSRGLLDSRLEIWNECTRLLSNIIIFYNTYILSKFMVKKEGQGKIKAAKFIRKMSTIASQHINLGGRHEFKVAHEAINIEQLMAQLDKIIGELD